MLTTQCNADGDGLGALLGLSHCLTRPGTKSTATCGGQTKMPIIANIDFCQAINRMNRVYNLEQMHSTACSPPSVVDTTTSKKRIGDVAGLIRPATKTLVIDHHVDADEESDVRVIDSNASSASELIYSLINWYARRSNTGFTPEIATCLYAGIVFDTKLFKHSHPERALRAAAELVTHGADPQQIAENMFSHQTYQTVKTLGFALSNLMLHENGQISTLYVDHKTHAMNGDLDGVVDHAMSIDGVEVALFFKEQEPGQQRVSLRSRGKVDVNRIARQFDGGGHILASGCEIKGSVNEVQARLLSLVREQL